MSEREPTQDGPNDQTVSTSAATPCYRAGNMQGRYFTQWRVDLLADLLRRVRHAGVDAEDAEIWYDEPSDFHYLSFMAGGEVFAVRFYKVFSMSVNGVDDRTGVLRCDSDALVRRVRERVAR